MVGRTEGKHRAADVVVNVRYLSRPLTGLQRYTLELLRRWRGLVDLASPGGKVGPYTGHLWEQVVLPVVARGRLLFSPSNTGPVFFERQVVTIHDMVAFDLPEVLNPQVASWYRIVLSAVARRAYRIITVSSYSKKRILQLLEVPESKVVVIPNGVGNEFCPPSHLHSDELSLHLPSNRYLFALSRFHPVKNLVGLLRAWAIASKKLDPDIWLVVAGNQGPRTAFGQCELKQIPPRVFFYGAPDDATLPVLYRKALGFVHVSLYEGFGIPVLEAMACGTPVLASNVTAVPEVAGDAALLVDPTDVRAIAEGIERIVQDEELRSSLREKGIRRASLYSWDETARRTWEVLQSAMDA
jgi:glycosyltransferase involved in cell wall biosynthesis